MTAVSTNCEPARSTDLVLRTLYTLTENVNCLKKFGVQLTNCRSPLLRVNCLSIGRKNQITESVLEFRFASMCVFLLDIFIFFHKHQKAIRIRTNGTNNFYFFLNKPSECSCVSNLSGAFACHWKRSKLWSVFSIHWSSSDLQFEFLS